MAMLCPTLAELTMEIADEAASSVAALHSHCLTLN